ncbi:MAG: TetR/AcrR family transcriptional regulator [Deltaproteobacteria bacterium]
MSSQDRREKERESRRSAILKAARKLFFDRGFKNVTVDNIAAKAEVSKGSVYLYFKSKEEIYTQILINDSITSFRDLENKFSAKDAPAAELLLAFADSYIDYFLNENELFRILMTFMLHADDMILTDEQNAQLLQSTNDNIKFVSEILQKGVDAGEFSPILNIKQAQNAIWGLLNGIISLFLFMGKPERRAERIHSTAKDSLKILIKGLKA